MSKLEESAFGLSKAELEQIRYMELLKKRKATANSKPRVSDTMSTEAQIAMQMALDDMVKHSPQKERSKETECSANTNKVKPRNAGNTCTKSDYKSNSRREISTTKTAVFQEAYERLGSSRMHGDITDDDYDPLKDRIRGLGGCKYESAMETTEIVYYEDDNDSVLDEKAIEEIAKRNAIDKCEIWMDVSRDWSHDPNKPSSRKWSGDEQNNAGVYSSSHDRSHDQNQPKSRNQSRWKSWKEDFEYGEVDQ